MDIIPILREIENAELWELGNAQQAITARLEALRARSRFPIEREGLEYLVKVSNKFVELIQEEPSCRNRGSAFEREPRQSATGA